MTWPEPVRLLSLASCFGQTEVGHSQGLPSRSSRTFAGFRSRWDHASLVGIFNRFAHAPDHLGRVARRERALGEPLGQALAFDETHREVMLTLMLTHLEDGDDARMVQVRGGLGLWYGNV